MGTLSLEPSNIMHLKVLTVFAIICSSALADQFGKYQSEFGKQYTSPKEYVQRKAIFEANLKEIEKHNENRANTYTMGVNQFTDMTQNEFDALIQGLPKMPKEVQKNNERENTALQMLRAKYANYQFEETFSWVDQRVVTSVKNQGQCGSCTAFAVTGAIESCYAIKTGQVFDDLAEQFLVDCAYGYSDENGFGAEGCSGAWPQAYLHYFKHVTNGQHQMESCYPYTAQDGTCKDDSTCFYKGATMASSISYWGTNDDELKALLVEYGPVVTSLNASPLGSYSGGIFDSWQCCDAASTGETCTNNNNHAVLVVGYGPGYWLVKNSWGSYFGEDGYFKIKSGTGHCGFGWQVNSVPIC